MIRSADMSLARILKADYADLTDETDEMPEFKSQQELDTHIANMESDMREAARKFEFEKAAKLRDRIKELRTKEFLFGRVRKRAGRVCRPARRFQYCAKNSDIGGAEAAAPGGLDRPRNCITVRSMLWCW